MLPLLWACHPHPPPPRLHHLPAWTSFTAQPQVKCGNKRTTTRNRVLEVKLSRDCFVCKTGYADKACMHSVIQQHPHAWIGPLGVVISEWTSSARAPEARVLCMAWCAFVTSMHGACEAHAQVTLLMMRIRSTSRTRSRAGRCLMVSKRVTVVVVVVWAPAAGVGLGAAPECLFPRLCHQPHPHSHRNHRSNPPHKHRRQAAAGAQIDGCVLPCASRLGVVLYSLCRFDQ